MKKIFVLGMLVGIVSVCGARAELIEAVTTTENEVVTVDNPVVEEPVVEPEPVVVEEAEVDEVKDIVPEPEPEPEPEPIEEYPVPTEDIPD